MKMAMWLDYKPTRYEGKGFLHRDITGEMGFGVDREWRKNQIKTN